MSRKRHSFTLDEKLKILQFVDEHPTMKRVTLAKQLDIPITTLQTFITKRQSIEASVARFDRSCRATRTGQYKQLDDFVFSWLSEKAAEPDFIRPSLEEMREMAEAAALSMGIDGFTASNGWLSRFNKRHGFLRYKKRATAQRAATVKRRHEPNDFFAFLSAREQYHPRDVYAVGWTELYYALLPSDISQSHADGQLSDPDAKCFVRDGEPRVGIVLGVNEDCTDRLTPCIIGLHENPGSLRGTCNLPCVYLGGARPLQLTAETLQQYLHDVDKRMRAEKRRVAVFLPQHLMAAVQRVFTNLRLYAFASSTRFANQNPLYMGVLRRFKELYRMFLVKRLAILNSRVEEARPTLFIAMSLVATSWDSVEQETVRAAFKACGFRGSILAHLHSEQAAWEAVDNGVDKYVPLDSYVQVDEEDVCDEVKVLEHHENADATSASDKDVGGHEEQVQQSATKYDALKALDTLRLFLCSRENAHDAVKAYRALEKAFYNS
uniref:Putative tigger transposase n=1 Tax=Amblyomma triste TaxID=251400 RepID=A0A023GKS5_AMBTT